MQRRGAIRAVGMGVVVAIAAYLILINVLSHAFGAGGTLGEIIAAAVAVLLATATGILFYDD